MCYQRSNVNEIYDQSSADNTSHPNFRPPYQLRYFDISNNDFEGVFHVYPMSGLVELNISYNSFDQFNFQYVYDSDDQYSSVVSFDISHNNFSGNISSIVRLFQLS